MAGYQSAFDRYYDALTADVDYRAHGAYLKRLAERHGGRFRLVLDLACGTGSLAVELARLGAEVIAVDGSGEMLAQAMNKSAGLTPPVLYLCQGMEELDLYGTVDTTLCTLDSLNHLPDREALRRVFHRVWLFTEPGGLFLFDMNTPYKHREVLGALSLSGRHRRSAASGRTPWTPGTTAWRSSWIFSPGKRGTATAAIPSASGRRSGPGRRYRSC